jgi:DNA-binding transcriptional MerR regulator
MLKHADLLLNTDTNVDLIGRLYDMQDQARRDQEHIYKKELLQKKREHKEELQNLREQYNFLMKTADDKLKAFVQEFKDMKTLS